MHSGQDSQAGACGLCPLGGASSFAFVWNTTRGEKDEVLTEEETGVPRCASPLSAVSAYFWNVFL